MVVGQTARAKWSSKVGVIKNFLQDGTVVIEYHVEYEGHEMKGEQFFDPADVVIVDQNVQQMRNFKRPFHIELEKIFDSVVFVDETIYWEIYFAKYKTFLCELRVLPNGKVFRRFGGDEEFEFLEQL